MIIVEDLYTPTLLEKDVCQVHQVSLALSWMDPILKFLERDILLEEKIEAEKIRRKAPRFWLSEDKKVIQTVIFWAVPTLCTSRDVRVTPRGAA